MPSRNFFFFKNVLFEYARSTQNLRILRDKMCQNVIFCVQIFFQNLLLKSNFFFKIVLFKNIFFSWKLCLLKLISSSKSCFLKNIFLQNLATRKTFDSKSDLL